MLGASFALLRRARHLPAALPTVYVGQQVDSKLECTYELEGPTRQHTCCSLAFNTPIIISAKGQ